MEEKEALMGYARGATATLNVTENQRSIRIGRALDGTTMRWLGAFMAAKQQENPQLKETQDAGGERVIHPAFMQLHYDRTSKQMMYGQQGDFKGGVIIKRKAKGVVEAMLASDRQKRDVEAEKKGGSTEDPPQ